MNKPIIKDWQGTAIAQPENLQDRILVWTIEPHPYVSGLDYLVERDYAQATAAAKDAIEYLMDNTEESELREDGIQLRIGLEEMTLEDYLGALEK